MEMQHERDTMIAVEDTVTDDHAENRVDGLLEKVYEAGRAYQQAMRQQISGEYRVRLAVLTS
jgi:hypothetical protein